MQRAVRNACHASFGALAVMVVRTKDLNVLHAVSIPATWRMDGTPVPGEVNDDGVILFDVGVVDEVRHEVVFNRPLSRLAVGQQTDLVAGNVKVVGEPLFDALRIVDARLEIPDVAGFIIVNTFIISVNDMRLEAAKTTDQ